MKNTARVSVLAGLLLAPAAIASANEVETPVDGEQLESVVAGEVSTEAVPYNVVASTSDEAYDIATKKARLTELFNLNETATVANYANYRSYVNTYLGDVGYEANQALLIAKIDFLEELQKLAAEARDITNVVTGLKDTNKNLFEDVKNLEARYASIEKKYLDLRKELDDEIDNLSSYKELEADLGFGNTDFETLALGGLQTHLINSSDFIDQYIGAATVEKLTSYIEAIEKPKAFIYGGKIEVAKDSSDNPPGGGDVQPVVPPEFTEMEDVPSYVEDIVLMDADYLSGDTEEGSEKNKVLKFLDLLENANKFYNDKMTAQEKKIADSHELEDKRLVSVVMKQANDDLAKANKVNALLAEIKTMNESDFKKKVEAVVKEYDKLNPRQKILVTKYSEVMYGDDTTSENSKGYADALTVYNQVAELTKKRLTTEDYRKAVKAAKEAYKELGELGRFVSNIEDLNKLIKDLYVATGYVADSELPDIGQVENDYDVNANSVEQLITNINFQEDIIKARNAYEKLTKDQQKLVANYKDLQKWEKYDKSTIKVDDQISSIVIENTKTFVSKTESINKNYEKLSDEEKKLITNYNRLEYILPFSTVTGAVHSLKETSPTYKNDVEALLATLKEENDDTLKNALKKVEDLGEAGAKDKLALETLKSKLLDDIVKRQGHLNKAGEIIELIDKANGSFTDNNAQLTAIQDARAAYTGLPKEEQKLVTNLKTLTDLEKMVKQPAAVTKSIEEVDPEAKTFASKAKSAVTAFEKLTTSQKSFISAENKNRVTDFKTYLAFVDQVKALKSSDPGFQDAYKKAKEQYDKLIKAAAWKSESDYNPKIIKVIETYKPTLDALDQAIETGNGLVKAIDDLGLKVGQAFLNEVERIETEYSLLSPDGKKQVVNYKQFQDMKKDGTAALKVVDLINDPIIKNRDVANRNYAKKVDSALKAYEKLSSRQKSYVYNYTSGLQPYLKVYQVVEAVNNLKPTAKTYIEDVAAVRAMYDRLTTVEKNYLAPLLDKIEGAETGLVTVNEVMDMIDEARPGVEDYVQKLVAARDAYDKLARINSSYQKLVLNYKTLQEREKALKPVTTSIHQIIELEEMLARPFNQASDFVKKYNTAVKAYESIPYESRELVYNRDVLLSKVLPVAKTMEAIQNIKSTSKTFGEDVVKARFLYDALSAADKALVTNYRDLQAFEDTVSGGSAVDDLIRQIPQTGPTGYMQAIKDARSAYDMLMPAEKKAVTLYKELQNYEKGVKNVQAAIDAIDNVQFASNLVSAYDKATKALDKLTAEQRQMVPNLSKLQSVGPAIEVYKLIASLKPSSANYAGSVQAAYAAYNMLSSAEKQFVTNFAALQEAKNNVDIVQEVISKIAGLSSSAGNYAKQVEEAMALYNSLPSSVRKLVTNYDMLKAAEKESEAVDKVRSMISEINPNVGNFSSKVKAARSAYDKLSTQQKRLVTNYFLLEDYESEIDGSTLFF